MAAHLKFSTAVAGSSHVLRAQDSKRERRLDVLQTPKKRPRLQGQGESSGLTCFKSVQPAQGISSAVGVRDKMNVKPLLRTGP
jgi:hypothetical protein